MKIENILTTNAQVICDDKCSLQFYNRITSFFQAKYIKINGEKYNIENIHFKEPILDNQNQGYQLVTINLKEYHGNHNEIVKIEIFKNKEIVAKRIAKIIVGR